MAFLSTSYFSLPPDMFNCGTDVGRALKAEGTLEAVRQGKGICGTLGSVPCWQPVRNWELEGPGSGVLSRTFSFLFSPWTFIYKTKMLRFLMVSSTKTLWFHF